MLVAMSYRFFRGRIEFSGDSPEMFAGVVRAKLALSAAGRKIVEVLHDVLRVSVMLRDEQRRQTHHLSRSPDRLLGPDEGTLDARRMCTLRAKVNDRWMLFVVGPRGLHPDAESLVKWAAERLAVHLPRRSRDKDEPVPPAAGGGGSGGSAEIGIPLSWARKRSN